MNPMSKRRIGSSLPLVFLGLLALTLLTGQAQGQAPDRGGPPNLGPPPTLTLPPIQEDRLSNGLSIVLMEKHDLPLVQVNLTVFSGADREVPGKFGVASMTADMMDEGAGGMDALELADALEFMGVRLRTRSGDHAVGISLNTPLSKLDEALPVMADILLRPDFPAEELERKRRSALTGLLQVHDQPTAVAAILFAESLYGKAHPYGRAGMTDEASIRSISVADLRAFHESYVRPNNAAVVVVGDVTMDEIKPRLERLFGGWEAKEVAPVTLPTPAQVEETEVLLVDKPGAAQSVIQIGRIGVSRDTEDYPALMVMNTVLGGSFTSRLNQNLREDKGWTYGAGSGFSFAHTPGPFRASSSVQTEVTGPALEEFFKEFNGIRDPIPQDELDRAKNYEALGYPALFGSVGGIAGQLEELVEFDLPRDSFNRYVSQILSVTQAQAQAVARKYVVPGELRVIVVGDREKIEDQVRALDLGPVRVLTVEEVLGPKPVLEDR